MMGWFSRAFGLARITPGEELLAEHWRTSRVRDPVYGKLFSAA
jgi:hypothetical protein